jgi:hypothetical protein
MFADDQFASSCDAKYGYSIGGAAALAAHVDTATQVRPAQLCCDNPASNPASKLLLRHTRHKLRRRSLKKSKKSCCGSTRAST